MEFDPRNLTERDNYKLLSGSIVPRPIAWVSTRNGAGLPNLAPFSFFNMISSRSTTPPLLILSIGRRPDGRKDTARNILETGEFVVNIVSEELAEAMYVTSLEYGPEENEFEIAGLTALPGVRVRAPRVKESPIQLECTLNAVQEIGQRPNTLVIGEVVYIHIRDDLVHEGRIDFAKLRPLGRLAGDLYCKMGEVVRVGKDSLGRT